MRYVSCCLVSLLLTGLRTDLAAGQNYAATLTPDQEVPPTPSTATGTGSFAVDADDMLVFDVTVQGLHGAETACRIHGPAAPGATATPLFSLPLGGRKTGRVGPLTSAQRASLEAGLFYINVHTTHHANGEIRGQIRGVVAVEPESWTQVKARYAAR